MSGAPMQQRFFDLVAAATRTLRDDEVLLANYDGEDSQFVRFNRARVRQAMTVEQARLTLRLVDGRRSDGTTLTLSGDPAADTAAVTQAVAALRAGLPALPEDPYLSFSTTPASSTRIDAGTLPAAAEALDVILHAARGTDLVGICASGPIQRGFASSIGHRHWHEVPSFHFDWSLYCTGDKAVKASYAASSFDADALRARLEAGRQQLDWLARPGRTIEPGRYRAYLAPAALEEIVSMLNWDGVSAKAQRTKTSCLQKLVDGEQTLSPLLTLREGTAHGLAPSFDQDGFERPADVLLIDAGRHAGSMISARTAQEYGIAANGAGPGESMLSPTVGGGALAQADALRALGTGVYIGNLWYLNFSDRPAARITGMTRFASFWVEDGQVVAPVNVMRFDDSLYRLLGSELEALTRETERLPSASTYDERAVECSTLPGALLRDMTFTL